MAGTLTTGTQSIVVPRLATRVFIDGIRRRDVVFAGCSRAIGLGGALASFVVPTARHADSAGIRPGQEIVVYAAHVGSFWGDPIFRGWIATGRDGIVGELAQGSDHLSFSAESPVAAISRAVLGQTDGQPVWRFAPENRKTGEQTPWTVASIIATLLTSSGGWPSDWDSKLALGSMRGLYGGRASLVVPGEVVFVAATFREALGQMLGLIGDAVCVERFTPTKTYLDFVRFGATSQGASVVRVAAREDAETIGTGPNVSARERAEDWSSTATRVLGFGGPNICIVTLSTDPDDHPLAGLVPAWPDASSYDDIEEGTLSEPEQAVLDDPRVAKRGSEVFRPECEYCFRLFKLPPALANLTILPTLGISDADGNQIPAQAFAEALWDPASWVKMGTPPSGYVGGSEPSLALTDKTLLPMRLDTAGRFLLLTDPAIQAIREAVRVSDSAVVVTCQRHHVRLTVAVASDRTISHDTGVVGSFTLSGITTSGVVESIRRPDLRYVQTTADGMGITTASGEAVALPCSYYDPAADQWHNDDDDAPRVLEDDSPTLAGLCNARLRQRNAAAQTEHITLPYLASGLIPGTSLCVRRGDVTGPPKQIVSISYRGAHNPETVIVATSAVPDAVRLERPDPLAAQEAP